MIVLVTGAAGYVGQHLCLKLLSEGYQVRGLSRSARPAGMQHMTWVQGDVNDAEVASRAADGCQAVFHLACMPMAESAKDPAGAVVVNELGTVGMLEAALSVGVEKFIYTSSGQVYGGQSNLPNREGDLAAADSAYAVSKLNAEQWCAYFAEEYDLSVQILRLFNVYGAAVDGCARRTVESIFLENIAAGRKPKIHGNPRSGRDFISIHDVVQALQLALEAPAIAAPINVGTGALTTLVELAAAAGRVLGREDLEPLLFETHEPAIRFQADTSFAQRALGFRAEVSLENGLKEIVG